MLDLDVQQVLPQQAKKRASWSLPVSNLTKRYLPASKDVHAAANGGQQSVPNLVLITGRGNRSKVKGVSPVREALERLLECELRLVDSTSEMWAKG